MAIVIKKRVELGFLGDEYKDSYLILRSISVNEHENIGDKTVKEVILEHFIEGKIQQGEDKVTITKDNLGELSGEVLHKAFEVIAGVVDPKVEGQ